MKKLICIILCLGLLTACAPREKPPVETTEPPTESQAVSGTESIELHAVFSSGDMGQYREELLDVGGLTAEQINAMTIAQALSDWTGLDFSINGATRGEDSVTVDWAPDSTLIAGLGDRVQKEEFRFYDQESLCWFMMDSMYVTLMENLHVSDVYYTMDGGQTLMFQELSPVSEFPPDIPYVGSSFYFHHADGLGDDFSETLGQWVIEGEFKGILEPSTIKMDGQGGFETFDLSGNLLNYGHLIRVEEPEAIRYDLYTEDGTLLDGIYLTENGDLFSTVPAGPVYHPAEQKTASRPAMLRQEGSSMGLEPLESDDHYRGGYYFSDGSPDGLIGLINCCYTLQLQDGENLEAYAMTGAGELCGSSPESWIMEPSQSHSDLLGYPVYLASWTTGGNEDLRQWTALFFNTEAYTYWYAFDVQADAYELQTCMTAFDQLVLE